MDVFSLVDVDDVRAWRALPRWRGGACRLYRCTHTHTHIRAPLRALPPPTAALRARRAPAALRAPRWRARRALYAAPPFTDICGVKHNRLGGGTRLHAAYRQ